jgi:hypothetical protein
MSGTSDYDYDVFISYRKINRWPDWLDRTFRPLFEHFLMEELGYTPEVFVDRTGVPEGTTYPVHLARALAHSRILLPLCSRTYFASDWCKLEFGMMRAREDETGLRSPREPRGLIVPVIVHDGDAIHGLLRPIQPFNIAEHISFTGFTGCVKALRFEEAMKQIAFRVAETIVIAPPFKPGWEELVCDRFLTLFRERGEKRGQLSVPRLTS